MRLVTVLLILGAARVLAAQELPDGPGRPSVIARCSTCHEADLIVQQRLSRPAWGREIDKMVRWGAVVDTGEREMLLDYLAAHFRPKGVARAAGASAEAGYQRACLVCHDEDLIAAQRLTPAGWTREVDKMVRWGAVVSDAERRSLAGYLAERFPVR